MKQRGWPLWLLRDVRAFLAVLFSFWTLTIYTIASERALMRKGRAPRGFLQRHAMLLATAEAWLDWAFWRQAHRRLGLDHRAVKLRVLPPTTTSQDSLHRWRLYSHAFDHMQAIVDSHIEALRQRYRISERDARTLNHPHRRAARATSPGSAGGGNARGRLASLSRLATGGGVMRVSAHDGGGLAFARGPPPIFKSRNHPPRSHLRDRPRMSAA